MTEKKEVVQEPAKAGNPQAGDKPKAGGQADQNQLGALEKTVTELKGKLEALKGQYKGSTEEALRLKNELETISGDRDKLKELVTNASQRVDDNDTFQSVVEKEGLQAAIRRVVREETSPLSVKVDKLSDKDVDEVYNNFKSSHPGLEGDVLTKFDKEFERLKGVYDTLDAALEAAYAVAGGTKAEKVETSKSEDEKKAEELAAKSEKDRERAAKQVSEDGKGKQEIPGDPQAAIKQRIENLKTAAANKEANGSDARDDWATISNLEQQLKDQS